MDERNTIQIFSKLLGQTIVDIKYIETKFHYDLSGDWTNVNTELFVLHSPEWEIGLASGEQWFLTNPQGNLTVEAVKSNITVSTSTIAKVDDVKHSVPNSFGWKNILDKKITGIRFYKRLVNNKKFLGFDISKTYQDNIQIIQFVISGTTFSISTMDGDIGESNFYPTGSLGERLGFFFDKTITDNYTVNGLTLSMEITDEVKWKE
ncbi:MAG: hypothetical protein ACEQSR_07030 [Candidatus Methylacidiphilales bacterium]